MKVCFLLGNFTSNGGIGRVTSILVNEMVKNQDVEICTLSYARSNKPPLYVLDEAIQTDDLFPSPISMRKAFFKNAVGRLANYIHRNGIDILVACGSLYFPMAVSAARRTKIKCICWDHTGPTVTTDHAFQAFSRKFGAKRSDVNVVLTKAAKSYYDAHLREPSKNIVMYNPIDAGALAAASDYSVESHKILAVGRLSYQKNFEAMIRVAQKVLSAHPEWTWDVYGEGPLREDLERRIAEAGLSDRFFLRGQVDDLYKRYSAYSLIVMTSRYEGFPMTLLEASANGLPMVSYDVATGPNEIIKNGENGFLIPFDDEAGMCDVIEQLISDESLRARLSQSSKETSKEFELSVTVDAWFDLFRDLLKEGDKK